MLGVRKLTPFPACPLDVPERARIGSCLGGGCPKVTSRNLFSLAFSFWDKVGYGFVFKDALHEAVRYNFNTKSKINNKSIFHKNIT